MTARDSRPDASCFGLEAGVAARAVATRVSNPNSRPKGGTHRREPAGPVDHMTTFHRWFESGEYSLLGHTDLPEQCGPVGVVIVPPFGWEDVCSYRPLRFLARSLAGHGIPVLRFDLPGTGDSSGSLLCRGLVEAWVQSVGDAAAELRALAGVEQVALLGIRLGATLAAVAASRGANVQDLVLWGVSPSGRVELREMRAYARMERWEFSVEPPAGSEPAPASKSAGS